jgi:hypothetical protein
MITIRPHLFRQFGDAAGVNFYVLTNPSLEHNLTVEQNESYLSYQVLTFAEDFLTVVQSTKEPAHILVISPDHFISSVDPACLWFFRILWSQCLKACFQKSSVDIEYMKP